MDDKISVVINTYNEEKLLNRCIDSVKGFADEILVCDMHSTDETVATAKKLGARVIFHKWLNFVEPARNFAISQAKNNWILILDPDEEIPKSLADNLKQFVLESGEITHLKISRKNIVFGKWMKAAMWWPDYNIRFFKKGSVKWSDKIHRDPVTEGEEVALPSEENLAIVHHHYTTITQFLTRLDRYTDVQAKELFGEEIRFNWSDLIRKPMAEFLGRFFANKGYLDGVHGFALSMMQAFSFLIVYLKLWEAQKFPQRDLSIKELDMERKQLGKEISYWVHTSSLSKNPVKRFIQKAKGKLS